jgi:leader peptidase (prepilin peptidase)/N-methyltransferase
VPLDQLSLTGQLLAAILLGLVVGSFLNVLILRLPRKMYAEHAAECAEGNDVEAPPNRWFGLDFLISPASTCPQCGHRIRAWENIPLLSWLLLRGRCSSCRTPISIRYPIIELISGLMTGVVVHQFGFGLEGFAAALLTWGLIALTIIDIDEQLLPDQLTLPLLWVGLLLNLSDTFVPLTDAVIGAAAGYLSLWLVFQVFRLLTGKEGMGYGDFKLFAVFGAWLGWQALPLILLLSSLVGAVIGIGMVVFRGKDHQIPIPFGPYLAIAGIVAVFWGDSLNQAYLQFAGLG